MSYFSIYSSNTYAGSGNQHFFKLEKDEICKGRVYYKIANAGKYNYSLLFSSVLDSTFADGSVSHVGMVCTPWEIISARVARCKSTYFENDITSHEQEKKIHDTPLEFYALTFNKNESYDVKKAELFASDPILIDFCENEYLCLEIEFRGECIPYHEESLLPCYRKTENGWKYNKQLPFASMIGCDRAVSRKIGFIGDSITQGIGTKYNSYLHWNALLGKSLGSEYACWNLGLGFGRAQDMAQDGSWAYKAKQNDVLVVCYAVNDIMQGFSTEVIKGALDKIVEILKKENKRIIFQTVPPFDYDEEKRKVWNEINDYILTVIAKKVDYVFDNRYILGKNEIEMHIAKYGGHPNEAGCLEWANALYKEIKDIV